MRPCGILKLSWTSAGNTSTTWRVGALLAATANVPSSGVRRPTGIHVVSLEASRTEPPEDLP
jgi:hypothetical protein